jgi:carbonic anhydrase/acetyltransferase-like protein (isoleucine patch superfamily)
MQPTGSLVAMGDRRPDVDATAWVAPGAMVVGDVGLGASVSVWYAAVLRADGDRIEVGSGSNIQDGCVVHADPGVPVHIGTDVSVGHRAVLHGCRIGDGALLGMGAIVLNGVEVGPGCLLAAGTVVLEGTVVPSGSLVTGVPGKVRRELTADETAGLRANAETYRRLGLAHRAAWSAA